MFLLFWISGLTLLLLLPSAAAELPALNCSVSQLPDGLFRYRLSGKTGSDCSICWEDWERNVIARDSMFNKTIVRNLTDEFIDLKICQHHLRHITECFLSPRYVDCRVNCSLFEPDGSHPNSGFCLSRSLYFDRLTGVVVVAAPAAAVVLLLIVGLVVYKRRLRRAAAAYALTETIELESQKPAQKQNDQ